MRHKATPQIKEKLIEQDNQAKAELIASADGKYPEINLHDVRHITQKYLADGSLNPLYGRELLDPNPMQPPVPIQRGVGMLDTIREQIRIAKLTEHHHIQETIDEADDFDIPDEPADPTTRWENDYEPSIKELRANRARLDALIAAAEPPPSSPTAPAQPQSPPPAPAPGATPPQRSGGGEDVPAPGGPSPTTSQKASFFGR